jgi:FkbM family methyltransferase
LPEIPVFITIRPRISISGRNGSHVGGLVVSRAIRRSTVPVPQQYNHLTQTRYGALVYNRFDTVLGRSIEMYGEYAEREISVLDQAVSAGMFVLDVGSYIGLHSLFLARKVGPAGRVLSFESRRLMFQTLCGNMAINSLSNVHCWNAAVGAHMGEITVAPQDHQTVSDMRVASLSAGGDGERVPLLTIDSLQLTRCDFIRLSQPGMEDDVLAGAQATLARFRPSLYIHSGFDPQQESGMLRRLEAVGYQMHWHEPELFNADNFAANHETSSGRLEFETCSASTPARASSSIHPGAAPVPRSDM